MMINESLNSQIYPMLSPNIVEVIRRIQINKLTNLTEIRLRINRPLLLVLGSQDYMINYDGNLTRESTNTYICTIDDIHRTFQLISRNSIYALEQELKMGFLTVMGGHRIGLAGQAIVTNGQLKAIKNISSMNVRIAREVKGCGEAIFPFLCQGDRRVFSTLIISPPRCGKTTILRDLIRKLSTASNEFRGVQVGVVDERSEIAACKDGIPTVDLGDRVDVLDGCPKSEGMLMLIRSMAPHVIATDELGREDDAFAVREALNAGISVLATVLGQNVAEVLARPYIGSLITAKLFERYVILSDSPSIGTVTDITEVRTGNSLYSFKKGVKACG